MEPDNRIRCPSCGEFKRPDDFVRNRAAKSGRGGYCKPCHNRISRANREKHHGTGLVRGILCFNCNRGLGKLREDPALMRAAIGYLEGTM